MNIAEQETGVLGMVDEEQQDEQVQGDQQEAQSEEVELEEISIAGAEAQAAEEAEQETPLIRQVREAQREEAKKRKAAERELAEFKAKAAAPAQDQAPVVGAKPKLEDFDFDSDQYEAATERWYEQKQARAAYEAKQRSTEESKKAEHEKVLTTYRANAAALPVDQAKFKAAEAEVVSTFDTLQQNILLKSKAPERLVYAIGNNPAKLEELAKIKDPIALAYELGRVESSLTVTKQKKSAPAPDRPLTGGSSGNVDSTLERLEAEAEKTGDRSKIVAFRRQLRQAK